MILVTGGTGLTGSFVVEQLLRRGQAVRVLTRPESAERARGSGAEVAIGDLGDPDSLRRAARDASGIIHTACGYVDRTIDIAAMRGLLDGWCAGPFVFVSSLDVYGLTDATAITEDAPIGEGLTDYATGKVICERLVAEAATATGRSDHTVLRAPYIWGPHPKARERLVNQRLRDGQPMILPGVDEAEWSRYRDVWIDVRDLAVIAVACLDRPAGGPLNVLAGHFVWHDLYAEVIRLSGSRSELVHKPLDAITDGELTRKELYARTWEFSAARLAQHLAWTPHHSLPNTLRDTVG